MAPIKQSKSTLKLAVFHFQNCYCEIYLTLVKTSKIHYMKTLESHFY